MTAVAAETRPDLDAVVGLAARAAADVDLAGRAPHEAVAALRGGGLLVAAVPTHLGGLGWDLGRLVEPSVALGGACSSAAAAFIAHQGAIGGLMALGDHPQVHAILRAVVVEGLLLDTAVGAAPDASGDLPGTLTTSLAPREHAALLVAAADTSALRFIRMTDLAPLDSLPSDPLGYRGVRPQTYEAGPALSAVQLSGGPGFGPTVRAWRHLLWSASWLGLTRRLAEQVRAHLHAKPEAARLRAFELEQLVVEQQALLAAATGALTAGLPVDAATLRGLDHAVVTALRLVVDAAVTALGILGMAGYANHSPRSVARLLRDAMGAPSRVDVTGIRLAAEPGPSPGPA